MFVLFLGTGPFPGAFPWTGPNVNPQVIEPGCRCLGKPLHLGLPWISLPLFTLCLHPPPCAEWVTSSSSNTPFLAVHKTMRVQWCADKWVNWSLLYMLSNGHMGAPPFLVGCDRTPIKTHPVTPTLVDTQCCCAAHRLTFFSQRNTRHPPF